MQKRILVLAVAAAIASPAFADSTTIYGAVDVAFDVTDNGVVSTNQVSSQVTKLGFKGDEDLGDGLSAVWQIEQQIDIDNSTASATSKNYFASRNSFGALKSASLGTVLLGYNDTPYKIATRNLDVFVDSLADNRSLMGGGKAAQASASVHDARLGDIVVYLSPNINGFSAIAAYVAGAELAAASADVKGSAWSLAGIYNAGPLYASLAYQTISGSTAAVTSQAIFSAIGPNHTATAWKLGGGYTVDALQINAVYEKTSDDLGAGNSDAFGRTDWYLAAKYTIGNDAVKAAYTSAGQNATANTDAKQISLGYDHNLSKNTKVYALYSKINNNSGQKYTFNASTSTAGGFAVAAGNDPSVWSLGLRHTF